MHVPSIERQLKEIVGDEHVLTSEVDLMLYGYDAYLEM